MLKVIGAGLPRTGTTSTKAALEQLGFGPCYHMFEIFTHPDFAERWMKDQPPVDWEYIFAGYRSTQDWPASHFWRELAAAYPDAKVILTVRDPHAWLASFSALMRRGQAMQQGGGEMAEPPPIERMRPMLTVIGQYHFGPDWEVGTDLSDVDGVAAFQRHTEAVSAGVPADRLLIFDVREGWQPLCEFLGVPVPDEPFPHLNDNDWIQRAFEHLREHGQMPTPF
jgi:hypothetical protein